MKKIEKMLDKAEGYIYLMAGILGAGILYVLMVMITALE